VSFNVEAQRDSVLHRGLFISATAWSQNSVLCAFLVPMGRKQLMMIEETRCPRCGIRRLGKFPPWGKYCFNCRLRLTDARTGLPPNTAAAVEPAYPFTQAERLRLERYRAAIRAGLYSDWPYENRLASGTPT
jgi:hypothetical protein